MVPVPERDLIDRLAGHRTVGKAPRTELEWLARHGQIRRLAAGQVLSAKGVQVEALYIVLEGRIALFVEKGGAINKMVEWRDGDVSGVLPYSRLIAPPGNATALEPIEVLAIPRDQFPEMTRECFEVTTILVHSMLDRARLFTSSDLLNEKMISLGKLSAGLAHELNNPASAIERCGAILRDRLEIAEAATRDLAAARLSDAQIATVDAVRAACLAKQAPGERSPLEQSDREDAIAAWLAAHGMNPANAEMLADTEVTFESLEELVGAVDPPSLDAVVRWAAAGCAVRNLTARIQDSAARISGLVKAVKGFTHMDHANVAEAVDIGPGLSDTVAVLRSKAREKSVAVRLNIEPGLPKARGFAAELNQVWGNLIDNALDAVKRGGTVEIRAAREDLRVLICVLDDGPGISSEVRQRIFDPFFSTKPQGMGMGLGLDIVRRLVNHNDGTIDFESQPGRTEFRVRLPIARLADS
jgi:signal transduction histidine kinase